jgi:hypothetical protein
VIASSIAKDTGSGDALGKDRDGGEWIGVYAHAGLSGIGVSAFKACAKARRKKQ